MTVVFRGATKGMGRALARRMAVQAGIDLAAGRDIRVTDHPGRRNVPAVHDVAQQRFERDHLRFGERVVAAIVQLDPD